MSDKPLAEQLFDLTIAQMDKEEDVFNAILAILAIDPDRPASWGFSHWTYDWYDHSFELKYVQYKMILTDEEKKALSDLGFVQAWFCYTDGTQDFVPFRGTPCL